MNAHDTQQELTHSIAENVLIAIRKIVQAIDLNSRRLVKSVGLTGPQLVVLKEVAGSGEESVGSVAKAISLSQGTVTDIIERMEKRGLVVRRRSEKDRRRVLVHVTEEGEELLEDMDNNLPDAVVLDYHLNNRRANAFNGKQVLQLIGARFPDVPVVMLTNLNNMDDAVSLIKQGAVDFIVKDDDFFENLVTSLEKIFTVKGLIQEVKSLKLASLRLRYRIGLVILSLLALSYVYLRLAGTL